MVWLDEKFGDAGIVFVAAKGAAEDRRNTVVYRRKLRRREMVS